MKRADLDFDSQELKQCLKVIRKIDFELVYLALLAREGLKPFRNNILLSKVKILKNIVKYP